MTLLVLALLTQMLSAQPSTGTVVVPTPAPLRAPVLLRQEVAFLSTEAARIEWETDRSAVGEVRYGTAARLAYTAKAPVFATSQAVTLDVSVFDPKDPLYYQLYWVDRQQLSGLSDIRPVALAEAPPPPPAPAPETPPPAPAPLPSAPKPPERTSQWLIGGGPAYRGKTWTWNAGAAYRPKAHPLEVAFDGSTYSHDHIQGSSRWRNVTEVDVTYVGGRVSYLYPLEALRGPQGERLAAFPGHLRVGAGMAVYRTKTHTVEQDDLAPNLNGDNTERDLSGSPFVEVGIARRLGPSLELQVAAAYATSKVQFGHDDYRPAGLALTLQLACRLK